MKKENAKPAEAKKTTKKVGRPKGRKTTKKEPKTEFLDFDVPARSNVDAEESEIERLKAELAKAKDDLDKLSTLVHREGKTYSECIFILMDECNWLIDNLPWYKKRSKKVQKKLKDFRSNFWYEYTKLPYVSLLRILFEE